MVVWSYDCRDVAQARKDLERVFGGKTDIDAMVARDPNWLQEVQRGDGLIPYDDPADEWEKTGD